MARVPRPLGRAPEEEVDLDALFPEAGAGVREPDVDLDALFPEAGAGVREPDVDLDALFPEAGAGVREPDVDLDALFPEEGKEGLTRTERYTTLPTNPPIDVPSRAELGYREQRVYNLAYDAARIAGMDEAQAQAEATRTVRAGLVSRGRGDEGKVLLGTEDAAVEGVSDALGGEATAAGRVVGALGPRVYGEAGRLDTPAFRLAENVTEEAVGESLRAATLHNNGMGWDEAKAQARKEAAEGLVLIENPQSRRTGTAAQTEMDKEVPDLPTNLGGAYLDVLRGVGNTATDLANLAKDVVLDAPMATVALAGKEAQRALGSDTLGEGLDANAAVRAYRIPSPFDWLAEAGWTDAVPGLGEAVQDTATRQGGITSGVVGAARQFQDASREAVEGGGRAPFLLPLLVDAPDPAGSRLRDRFARDMMATSSQRLPAPDKDGVQFLEDTLTGAYKGGVEAPAKAFEAGFAPGVTNRGEKLVEAATTASESVTAPVMDLFAMGTMPGNRETTIGQGVRVLGSVLQGLVTTQAGRAADYLLRQAGAMSYRTGRGPDDAPVSGMDVLLGPLTSGYWHDYATTLENGEGVTNEVMHAMDTYAKGMPGLTPEERATWLPGGTGYNSGIQAGIWGDLLLPLDPIPGKLVSATAGRGARFASGMLAATTAGVGFRDAVPMGMANAAPSLTDYVFRNDPDYVRGRDTFRGATDAAAETAAQTYDPTARVETRDVDPTTVALGTLYRYAARQGRSGRDFAQMAAQVMPHGEFLTADQLREVYTTLGVEPTQVKEAAAEAPTGPDDRTVQALQSLGYTPDRIAGMDVAEARQRVDEQVRPGTNADELPEVPMPRPDILRGVDRLRRVAEAKDDGPLTSWPEVVTSQKDPSARAGAALSAVAAHLGVTSDSVWARLALQAALSYYDPRTGRFRRSEFPTNEVVGATRRESLDVALDRLRRASPAAIWRAVDAFERGETVWFPDSVKLAETRASVGEATTAPKGSRVLDWLPEGSALRRALTTEGRGSGEFTAFQRVAETAAAWLTRAIEVYRVATRETAKAEERVSQAWFKVASALDLDPVVPPGVRVADALRRVLATEGLDAALVRNATAALAAYDALAGKAQSAEARIAAMREHAEATLAAVPVPTRETAPRKLPGRQQLRATLKRLAREGKVAYTPEQVDIYLTVWDRVAAALVKAGVIEKADDWYAMVSAVEGTDMDGAAGRAIIVEELGKLSEAIVELGTTADLAVLFHESAHVLRRILPPERMAPVDEYVQATFGGWTKEAEEWFAEQFEWVLTTGSLGKNVTDPVKASPMIGALNRALRLAARVLAETFETWSGPMRAAGMEFSPVMRDWLAGFLALDKDRVLSGATEVAEPRAEVPTPDVRKTLAQTRRAERVAAREQAERASAAKAAVEVAAPRFAAALRAAVDGLKVELPPEIPPTLFRPRGVVEAGAGDTLRGTGADAARRGFMGALGRLGVKYADVAAWTESRGEGRPADWTTERRRALLDHLATDEGKAEVAAHVESSSAQAKLPEVQAARDRKVAVDLVGETSEALIAAVGRGVLPMTLKKLKRVLFEAVGAALASDAGEAKGGMERVPAQARADLESEINTIRKMAPEVREAAAREAVERFQDQVSPIRETAVPAPIRQVLAPGATPPPLIPPPGLTVADGLQPTGPRGSVSHTANGQPRVMVDSEGLVYTYRVDIVPMDSVMTSHTDLLAPTEEYPQELQNRSDAWRREEKIEAQSRALDTRQLGIDDATPTIGAPAVWRDAEGKDLVAAGNGRALSIARALRRNDAVSAQYQAFVQATAQHLGLPQPGPFDIVIRRVDIAPDDFQRAVTFAQNSQKSTAEPLALSEELTGLSVKARAITGGALRVDSSSLPETLDATSAYVFYVENPDVQRVFAEIIPDRDSRETVVSQRGAEFVNTIKGVVLSTLDAGTVDAAKRASLVSQVADAVPAMGSLSALVAERARFAVADVSRYLGDALDLLVYARGRDMDSAKAMGMVCDELTRQVGFTTARPVPVSRVSLALAYALRTAPDALARKIGEIRDAVAASAQMGMFAAAPVDPAQIVIDGLTTAAQRKAIPESLPFDHADAVTRAMELQASAIESAEQRRMAANPLPLLPPKMLESRRVKVQPSAPKRTATLFSGGGMVEAGLEGLIDPVFAVEANPKIAEAYRTAHGDHVVAGDVRTVDMTAAGQVDYLHASPVCKNYSQAKTLTPDGEQPLDVETAEATARAIREMRPSVFTLENVAAYTGSSALSVIENALMEGGYTFDARVYEAADYGSPSRRKRLLLRAVKDGPLPAPPRPTGVGTGWYDAVKDLVDDLPVSTVPPFMAERLAAAGVDYKNLTEPIIVNGGSAGRNLPYAMAGDPAPTMKATPGEVHRIILPGGDVRRVTPRVRARLMGLPDTFPLPANEALAVTIVGNGVPTALSRAVFGPLLQTTVLESRRQNAEAVTPGTTAAAAGVPEGAPEREIARTDILRDDFYRGKAATPALMDPKDPKGYLYRMARAAPGLTREQMNTALGFAPDQKVYDAVDLQARAFAFVVATRLQSADGRSFRRMGKVAAVPVERVAAVEERARTLLMPIAGDIRDAQNASKAAPNTPVKITVDTAQKVRTLIDYLMQTGHAETLPRDLLVRPVGRLADTLTLWEWQDITDAVFDSVAGALPYRGRVEPYALAAVWLYNLTQRYGGLLVPEMETRSTPNWKRSVNAMRRSAGSAVLTVGSWFLAYEDFAPQMAEWVRPIWQRYHREIGSEPAAVVDRLERALTTTERSPTALTDALRSMTSEPAFTPIIDVSDRDGPSDLRILRGWLYRTFGENYTGTPLAPAADRLAGGWQTHDLPLAADDVPTVTDLYAHEDVVVRSLMRTDGVHGYVAELVDAIRSRTLTDDQAGMVLALLYNRLNACAARGRDILTSAAGKSGENRVAFALDLEQDGVRRLSGLELDAYEAFYQGRWRAPESGDPAATGNAVYANGAGAVVNTSIDFLTSQLAVGKAIPSHLWAFEVVTRFNVNRIVDRFLTELVERQYVRDLRDYYREARPDAPPPDLMTAWSNWQDVLQGARGIMAGQDLAMSSGTDARGVVQPGTAQKAPMSQDVRYAAKALLTRLGLLSDYAVERKGIKGNVVATPTADLLGGSANAALLGRVADNLRDPNILARSRLQNITWDGREVVLTDTMAEHIRHAMERHAPLGRYMGEVLANKDRANVVVGALREATKLLKGSFVTGGPNGWVATAMALTGMAGGANAAQIGMLALGGFLFTLPPRLPGFVNNLLSGFLYQPSALGWTVPLTLASPAAARVTAETVRFRRFGGIFRQTEALLGGMAANAVGDLNAQSFVSKNGRVYTLGMVAQISHEWGLDGTQARFESEEAIDQRLQRLDTEYQSDGFTGRLWSMVKSFYGRNTLAENYRKVYESIDSYFRHALLRRGLEDGMTPDEAVKRALLVTFDYSQLSPVDRLANRAFLFWMYTRRSIDLFLYTLVTAPHRALGPLRFMRQQDLTSGYVDTDDDGSQETENVPGYAQGSPAAIYLPVAGVAGKQFGGVKVALTEPPHTLAIRTMQTFLTGDVTGLAGMANPYAQFGANVVYNGYTGQWLDFQFGRDVVDDPQAVPAWFVRYDQAIAGGAMGQAVGLYPVTSERPSGQYHPNDPIVFMPASRSGRITWQAVRSLLPGASTVLTQREMADRADSLSDQAMNEVYEWFDTLDPLQQRPDASRFIAANAGPRVGVGRRVELSRLLGFRPVILTTPWNARTQGLRTYNQYLKDQEQRIPQTFPKGAAGSKIPLDTVTPGAPMGAKIPDLGIQEKR